MTHLWFFYALSLLSAASWALGSILWRKLGDKISPVTMNLSKGFIGSLLLGLCLLGAESVPLTPRPLLFLAVSGVIGIAVGDTYFFKALMQLGPRLTSLLGTLYPVSIALAATALLGERLSPMGWSGILVTGVGVSWVLWERAPAEERHGNKPLGLWYALVAIACTTIAVLLAKVGVEEMPAMEAALVRLLAGTFGLLLWGYATRGLAGWVAPLREGRLLVQVLGVVTIVVFGGFWLSLLALKHIDAAVAGTLNATSPLFILPLAKLLLKERTSLRAILGTALAVGGIGMLFVS